MGLVSQSWGRAQEGDTETVSVQREHVPLGCVKSSSTA